MSVNDISVPPGAIGISTEGNIHQAPVVEGQFFGMGTEDGQLVIGADRGRDVDILAGEVLDQEFRALTSDRENKFVEAGHMRFTSVVGR
jgi:hypothetical protein